MLTTKYLCQTAKRIHKRFCIPSPGVQPRGDGTVKGEGAFSEHLALEFDRRFAHGLLGSWEEERHRYEEFTSALDVLERRYREWLNRTGGVLTQPMVVRISCCYAVYVLNAACQCVK